MTHLTVNQYVVENNPKAEQREAIQQEIHKEMGLLDWVCWTWIDWSTVMWWKDLAFLFNPWYSESVLWVKKFARTAILTIARINILVAPLVFEFNSTKKALLEI